jgi:hypothetical protein
MAHDENQQAARDRRTSDYIHQALEQSASAWREWLDEETPYEFHRFPVKAYCWSVDIFFRSEEVRARAQAQEIDKQIKDAFCDRINAINDTLPEEDQFGINNISFITHAWVEANRLKEERRKYYENLIIQALRLATEPWANWLYEHLPFNPLGLYPHDQGVTFVFKSREVHREAERQGITEEIVVAIPAAVALINDQHKPDPPIEIRSTGFANIDEIHEAGGPLNFFM